jgi:uncharacterized protein (DUF58 family)
LAHFVVFALNRIPDMQRRGLVFLLLIGSLIWALNTGRALPFNLTYLLAGLLLLSFAWTWAGVNWVRLGRQTRARRAQVGRTLEERFTVRNTGVLPKLWLEVRDESELPGHHASQVVHSLGPGRERSWVVRTICRMRGRYRLGPVTLRSGDPFGLFQMERHLTPTSHVVVYPLTVDIRHFALPLGVLPGGDALRRRTHYVTANASGVRDYEPGDSFNRIHWRTTARKDRLIVKEFELDPLADVWVFLDSDRDAHFRPRRPRATEAAESVNGDAPLWAQTGKFELPRETEEYCVSAAASIAQYFIRQERATGVVSYGQTREVIQADRGERQLARILETLAVLRAEGRIPFDDVLAAESEPLPRGTTVIAVTPSLNQRWALMMNDLARRGLRVVAVLIDPGDFGGIAGGTGGIASILSLRGIPTYVVRYGDNLAEALSRPPGRMSNLV